MNWSVLFCALTSVASLPAMRGMEFNVLGAPERNVSAVGSQDGTQPLSRASSSAASSSSSAAMPAEPLTQNQKDAQLRLAIERGQSDRIRPLLNDGATFHQAVGQAVFFNKSEQLKIILDYNKEKNIFPPEGGYWVDPVIAACTNARVSQNFNVLRVLLADKRVGPARYIKRGSANGSPKICALFLLAAQGSLTEQDMMTAQLAVMTPGVGPVLMRYNNIQALYNVFPADQHTSIHEMLLNRGSGADHLKKAAASGNNYLVSRLLYTAPSGPFGQEDIAAARQAALMSGHKDVADILGNSNNLARILPVKLCTEFQNIVISTRPKINTFDIYHAQMGVNPYVARAKIQTGQKRAELVQAAPAEQQQAAPHHMNVVAPQQALLVGNKRKANDESPQDRMVNQKLNNDKKR